MGIWREVKRRSRDIVAPVLGFCVVGYFVYHSIEGERGLTAYVRLGDRLTETQAQLDQLKAERQTIERHVRYLRAGSLDPDLLEERARLILNYSRPDEIVIPDPAPR